MADRVTPGVRWGLLLCLLVGMSDLRGATPGDLVIDEILVDPAGLNTGRQLVEILNASAESIDFGSDPVWLRWPPAVWRIPAGVVLAPGERLLVHVNATGQSSANELFTGLTGMRNLRAADSLALYRSSLFQDPEGLLHFVQWGDAAQGGVEVAVAAGLWRDGETVDTSSLRPGASLVHVGLAAGVEPEGADAWCVDGTPTLGAPNDECTPAFARSLVTLAEVALTGGRGADGSGAAPFVEIENRGAALEDLGALALSVGGGAPWRFGAGTLLGPGERLVLWIGVDGEDSPFEVYTGPDALRPFDLVDSLSLHLAGVSVDDPSGIVSFVQWGAAGAPLEAAAVEAGRWSTGAFVDTQALHPEGALVHLGAEDDSEAWGIDNTPSPGLPPSAPPLPPRVVLHEIVLDPAGPDGGSQLIELYNRALDQAVDVSGYAVCRSGEVGAVCATLPPQSIIPAGGYLLILAGPLDAALDDEVALPELADLPRDAGELALFLTADTDDRQGLIDYVRWGPIAADSALGTLAEEVGIWPADGSVSVAALRDGSSLAYDGAGDGPADWRVDLTPSPGAPNAEGTGNVSFVRGDCNDDGSIDISDAVAAFQFLFLGGADPLCRGACDSNDDGAVDVSDPVWGLSFLFRGGSPPPPPGTDGTCGPDPTPGALTCDAYVSCAE